MSKQASALKFSELLEELERRLGGDLSQTDMEMIVQMKDTASVDNIEEVIRSDGDTRDGRTRRFEGIGVSTVVEITDIPLEDGDDEDQNSV